MLWFEHSSKEKILGVSNDFIFLEGNIFFRCLSFFSYVWFGTLKFIENLNWNCRSWI